MNTYNEAVSRNLRHMDTPKEQWAAVPVAGTCQATDDKGDAVSMPVFAFPSGYTPAPSLYTAAGECGLCAHPIKFVYWKPATSFGNASPSLAMLDMAEQNFVGTATKPARNLRPWRKCLADWARILRRLRCWPGPPGKARRPGRHWRSLRNGFKRPQPAHARESCCIARLARLSTHGESQAWKPWTIT